MAYEGDELLACPQEALDFADASVVVVSGAKLNPWGHMLLNLGGKEGYYYQVAGSVRAVPKYMNEEGYRRYLRENDKVEIRRVPVRIPDHAPAQIHLEELLSKPWVWWAVVENCQSFAEEIITAGGGRPIHDTWYAKPIDVKRQKTPGASGQW